MQTCGKALVKGSCMAVTVCLQAHCCELQTRDAKHSYQQRQDQNSVAVARSTMIARGCLMNGCEVCGTWMMDHSICRFTLGALLVVPHSRRCRPNVFTWKRSTSISHR
mmetsp:Transcript_65091/g.105529  ORF Transcript_65091/g.105529 Transcript_65091/m.105529 type:complete len:108 (-) Transcript_65091:63-386(-)